MMETAKIIIYFSCLQLAAAWQHCKLRANHLESSQGHASYHMVEDIDLFDKETAFVFSVKALHTARLRIVNDDDNSRGINVNIDVPFRYGEAAEGGSSYLNFMYRTGIEEEHPVQLYSKEMKLLDENQFKQFWISWEFIRGMLTFGAGDKIGENEIAKVHVENIRRAKLRYLYIYSAQDAEWIVYDQCQTAEPFIETDARCTTNSATACDKCRSPLIANVKTSQGKNNWIPLYINDASYINLKTKDPVFVLSIQSCSQNEIRFLTEKNLNSTGFVVIIDHFQTQGAVETFSTLVNYLDGDGLSHHKTEQKTLRLLKCEEKRDFWFRWNLEKKRLRLGEGRKPGRHEYLEVFFSAEQSVDVQYVAVAAPLDVTADIDVYGQCPLEKVLVP